MTERLAPIVKYGLPADQADRIVERHFIDTLTEEAIREAEFARLLRLAPSLSAALRR